MAMSPMFSGEMINKGISPVRGKVGEKIFSEKITVVDDPKNGFVHQTMVIHKKLCHKCAVTVIRHDHDCVG